MSQTYLTTEELSERIKYTPRTIRNQLVDYKLLEGVHYVRPFGGRKMLFIWEQIEKDMFPKQVKGIPMAAGGVELITSLLLWGGKFGIRNQKSRPSPFSS